MPSKGEVKGNFGRGPGTGIVCRRPDARSLTACTQATAPFRARSTTEANAAGLGVLGALYGMALVIAGVAARSRLNRLLGLGLIAAVVLKLYLADVWMMNRLSRILAFSALGALMLATSFFYSRFRARIEAWVRDDPAQTA